MGEKWSLHCHERRLALKHQPNGFLENAQVKSICPQTLKPMPLQPKQVTVKERNDAYDNKPSNSLSALTLHSVP